MKIEVITTENKDLKETGFGTLKSCANVLEAIKKSGHQTRVSVCQTKADLEKIVARQPDLVLLGVKYISQKESDDIWLADYFDATGINYMGSSRKTLNFDSNKVLAKNHLRDKGIKTADFFIAIPGQYKATVDLPIKFPLFLKPIDAANGNGVDDLSFVTNFSEFESKVSSLYKTFKLPVLVEEYLDGREFTVAVIKTISDDLIVSAIEIVPPESTFGLRILGEKAKTDDSEELKKIAESPMKNRIKDLAVAAFTNLGARDFGRIDIKTNKSGNCYFMEANLVPGMTNGSSYFPEACAIENDLNYDDLVELLVAKGLSRISKKIILKHEDVLPKLEILQN